MIEAELDGRLLRVNPQVAHRDVEGQTLFLLPEEHALHTLNDTGARVWHGLLEGQSIARIALMLSETYGVSADQAENDVRDLIAELVDKSILVPE